MRHDTSHRLRLVAAVLIGSMFGSACTVTQMQKDNEAAARRIEGKESTLAQAEAALNAQRAEQAQLLKDLSTREMNAEELTRRIDKMRQANAGMAASNQQLIARKAQIEEELSAASRELQGLPPPAPSRPDPAAAKKLEEAKRKVRKSLELLLAS